ncbi:hypothetical protein DY000_02035711 [Brassica cretica]|uniref:CASP-like protein n=1 Tax=Brassica cretica TaxID=69181 RepID=A0ABQ7DJM9_BRACR|nr:hypothetical protein DY000_02035711 [Brassica cretica]
MLAILTASSAKYCVSSRGSTIRTTLRLLVSLLFDSLFSAAIAVAIGSPEVRVVASSTLLRRFNRPALPLQRFFAESIDSSHRRFFPDSDLNEVCIPPPSWGFFL